MSLSVELLPLTRALWRAKPYVHNEKRWCDKPADDICSALHLSPSSPPHLVRIYLPFRGGSRRREMEQRRAAEENQHLSKLSQPRPCPKAFHYDSLHLVLPELLSQRAHSLHPMWSRGEWVSVIWEGTSARSSLSYCSARTTCPQHLRPHFSAIIITSMTWQAFHVCQACSILVEHLLCDNSGNC